MDKRGKQMWIVAFICLVMGFMYGWSAKEIDSNGLTENQMIISTNTPETMELCISDVVSITKALDTCDTDLEKSRNMNIQLGDTFWQFREEAFQKDASTNQQLKVCETDSNEWEHRFNIAMAVNEDLGVAAKKAQDLTGRCIEAFKKSSGL